MVAINWGRLGHTEIPPSLNLRGTIAEKVIWRYLFWSMVVLSSFGVQLASALIN